MGDLHKFLGGIALVMKAALQRGLLLFLMFTLIIGMVACSNATEEAPEEAPQATEPEVDKTPVEITITTWVPADSPEWNRISKAFTEKYPWITVKWLFNEPGEKTLKAVTESIAAGTPIDIFWNNTFYDVVKQGLAENLDPFIQADSEFQAYPFNPGILEPFQYQGSQYGLSRGNDTFVFFYNKDILDKYGVPYPTNDWSWEDLKEMAKKTTKPDDKVWGLGNDPIMHIFAAMGLPAANGSTDHIMNLNGDLSGAFTYNAADTKVMDDLQWYADLMVKDGVMLNGKRQEKAGIEGDMFANGNAAFYYHVSPTIPGFKDAWKFNWDIAPTPKGKAKQVGVSFNNPMFLAKASKHKQQAFEFMKFWAASVEGQKILMDIGGSLPNSSAAEITDAFKALKTYEGLNVDALIYASQIGQTDPTIFLPGGAAINEGNGGFHGEVIENEKTAYDYFPAVVDKTNAAIKEAQAQ
jgi:ABC-type glycerol-3-phosphate transport system substrate-binding protein